MRLYRCCFLDERDRVAASENIEAEALSEAVDLALAMLHNRPQHRAIEIWDGGARVYPTLPPGNSRLRR